MSIIDLFPVSSFAELPAYLDDKEPGWRTNGLEIVRVIVQGDSAATASANACKVSPATSSYSEEIDGDQTTLTLNLDADKLLELAGEA